MESGSFARTLSRASFTSKSSSSLRKKTHQKRTIMTTNTLPKFPPTDTLNDIEQIEKDIVSTYFHAIERIESVPSDARSWSNTFAAFSRAIGKASE